MKYLFVFPHIQGSGAGTALLDAVQVKIAGPISIHVFVVNDVAIGAAVEIGP